MARIKRKSVKTSPNSRRTTTSSSKGTFTTSNSTKAGNQRMTYTQKSNGQSYTTITTRFGDGSYERRRVSSFLPKAKKSKNMDNTPGGALFIILMIVIAGIAALFQ